ncbi:hypothetical protein ABZX63_30540 [Streptomyces tendae]|uniref:hypothetical protein n=1 Tax=Streptomyces tendae TaxID=1932 RepID=UPI0033AAF4F7
MSLAAVPSPPNRTKERTYEEIVRDIYNDKRADHEARELLLAVAYAVYLTDPAEGVSPLREARRVLGVERGRRARYDRLVAADAPRYEPPESAKNLQFDRPFCEAPRLRPYRPRPYKPRTESEAPAPTRLRSRRPAPLPPEIAALKAEAMATYTPPRDWRTEDRVCGADSHHKVLEKDPRTGWVTAHWFCKRHKDHADRVAEQVREQNEKAPEPVPNAGGLLPCYFRADWEKVYQHYRPRWEPPKYGICADDWPTPGETFQAHRRLRMVLGGEPEEQQ